MFVSICFRADVDVLVAGCTLGQHGTCQLSLRATHVGSGRDLRWKQDWITFREFASATAQRMGTVSAVESICCVPLFLFPYVDPDGVLEGRLKQPESLPSIDSRPENPMEENLERDSLSCKLHPKCRRAHPPCTNTRHPRVVIAGTSHSAHATGKPQHYIQPNSREAKRTIICLTRSQKHLFSPL